MGMGEKHSDELPDGPRKEQWEGRQEELREELRGLGRRMRVPDVGGGDGGRAGAGADRLRRRGPCRWPPGPRGAVSGCGPGRGTGGGRPVRAPGRAGADAPGAGGRRGLVRLRRRGGAVRPEDLTAAGTARRRGARLPGRADGGGSGAAGGLRPGAAARAGYARRGLGLARPAGAAGVLAGGRRPDRAARRPGRPSIRSSTSRRRCPPSTRRWAGGRPCGFRSVTG